MHCEPDELVRRVDTSDRRARMKWVDTDAVRAFAASRHLLALESHGPLDLDVTSLGPEDAAALILQHVEGADS
jgi:hypothetical protein